MIDLATYLFFVIAAATVIAVPGPTIVVVMAASLRAGTKAGLLVVLGTQAGMASMVAVLTTGLDALITKAGILFEIIRIAGALYLMWLGLKLWRADGRFVARSRRNACGRKRPESRR